MPDAPKSFQSFRTRKADAAPAPATVVVPVEKDEPAVTVRAVGKTLPAVAVKVEAKPVQASNRAMSVFAKPQQASALMAFVEISEEKPQFDLFPVVGLVGGNTGGQWDAAKHLPAELKRILPSGRKPIPAIVLGYRYSAVAWRTNNMADKGRPAWSCAIPSSDGELMAAVTKLAKQYQVTKKAVKTKYDFETSGVGHMRPKLCLLTYLPEQNMLVEVGSCAVYDSAQRSGAELKAHITKDGTFEPFACELEGETNETGENSADPWMVHHIKFAAVTGDKKAEYLSKFQAWMSSAAEDEETVSKYTKWLSGEDKPVTPEIEASISKGLTL